MNIKNKLVAIFNIAFEFILQLSMLGSITSDFEQILILILSTTVTVFLSSDSIMLVRQNDVFRFCIDGTR